MKTVTINLCEFKELTSEAQKQVLSNLYYVNVESDWWVPTYEDAERAGIKISSFALDGQGCIGLEFIDSPNEVANYIIDNHGEMCDTYKNAKIYLNRVIELKGKTKAINALNETRFLQYIREDYLGMLRKEYDYLTTYNAIVETIESNEWMFLENGERYEGEL